MRGSSARSERLPHKQEVAGSNPASAPSLDFVSGLRACLRIPKDQILFLGVENGRLVEKARIIDLGEPPG